MAGRPFEKGNVPWNVGKKHSETSKQKMRDWRCEHSEEVRQNIIIALSKPETQAKLLRGENHPMKRPEVVERMATSHRGTKRSAVACENIARGNIGKILTADHRRNISNGVKAIDRTGANNPFWKGGWTPLQKLIRKSVECKLWKSAVFRRDNYTCQECKVRGRTLHAHHIKAFAEIMKEYGITTFEQALACKELWDVENGITYCKDCHGKKHMKDVYKEVF